MKSTGSVSGSAGWSSGHELHGCAQAEFLCTGTVSSAVTASLQLIESDPPGLHRVTHLS